MWRVPPWTCWRRGTAACAWCGTACTTDRSRPRDEHCRSIPHPAPLHLPLPPPRTGADPPAGAAVALAGCRLPGLALRPASAELLHAGQLHRSGRAQTHAGQLPRPLRRGEHRHHRAHRLDGGRGDGGGGGSGVPDLLLHGALRNPAGAGAAVPRGIAAAVVQLRLDGVLNWLLSLPVIGGPSLSVSRLGMFVVFLYVWLPYMILPLEAALERVPESLLEASADLGARPRETFRRVVLPLAFPGVVAGSLFTFSLTLGDFVVPYALGNSALFIGQAVLAFQGTAANVPLAAAFTVVPMVIMAFYLTIARRTGAFEAL